MDTRDNSKVKSKYDMTDWWAGTVALTFFPIVVSMIVNLCRSGGIGLDRMIGDGELILAAFLVITPSVINFYQTNPINEANKHKKFFYLLLFVAFFQLTAYTSIKTNQTNIAYVVYGASVLCVISSIVITYQGEKILKMGGYKCR